MNMQNSSTVDPSGHLPSDEEKDSNKPWDGKVDWKPLNDLVEAANRSKSLKLNSQGSILKSEPSYAIKSEGNVRKSKGKVEDDKADAIESVKPKKFRRNRKKKSNGLEDLSVATAQAMVDASGNNGSREKRTYPIWFQLVPFEEQ